MLQQRDSFNYHTSSAYTLSYIPTKIVEINCWSRDTGLDHPTESSSNGSTTHEGSEILRFNCDFKGARGPVVADVNEGARTINFNVSAYDSYLNTSFNINGEDSKMWLFGCDAGGSTNAFSATSGSIGFYDSDTILTGNISGDISEI